MTAPSSATPQDDVINFLDNPETINKAVEGSMDKRLQTTDDTDTNVAMTSPTIDMELDGILDTLFVQGESFTSKHIDAKEAIKALIQSENLRVTLELMEKHHIPLQTHTLDGTSPHERSDTK